MTCNNGYPLSRIRIHLSKHHHFAKKLYESAVQSFEYEALAKDWKDLLHPSNGITPIEELKIRPGFTCTGCGYLTTSGHIIQGHSKCGGEIRQVDLQCWNSSGDPSYWTVVRPNSGLITANNSLTSSIGSFYFQCFLMI